MERDHSCVAGARGVCLLLSSIISRQMITGEAFLVVSDAWDTVPDSAPRTLLFPTKRR